MAERLARVFATEDDKVNCPFYFKIGACRYGANCQRTHNRPPYSQTVLLKNMYDNAPIEVAIASGKQVSENDAIKAFEKFEDFYEDIWMELCNYGEIEDLVVCDNMGDHLRGNVFMKYVSEECSAKSIERLRNRKYDNKLIMPEFSPVTDFGNAKCKQFLEGECNRGSQCNYWHLKPVSQAFKQALYEKMYEEFPQYKKKRKQHSRSKDKKKEEDRKKKNKKKQKRSRSNSRSSTDSHQQQLKSEERLKMIENWNKEDEEN